jgi:hypothetical protein
MNQGTAMVLAAVIGACGAIAASTLPELLKSQEAPSNVNDQPERVDVKFTASDETSTDWKALKDGVMYRARTDGFVIVTSGGGDPVKQADILIGSSEDKMQTRGRIGSAYGSAMAPVSKDEFLLVQKHRTQSEKNVFVHWKPMF